MRPSVAWRAVSPCREVAHRQLHQKPRVPTSGWVMLVAHHRALGGQGTIGSSRFRPQLVFLSHTSELRDLPANGSFVAAAEAAIKRGRHAVTDMAYFTARDCAPADTCASMVRQADIYVGIIGHRYGVPVRDRPSVSYTEFEFETATARHMPRLIFLITDDAGSKLASNQPDQHRSRQEAFRRRLQMAGVTIAWIASPAELEIKLYQALVELHPVVAVDNTRERRRPSASLKKSDLANPVHQVRYALRLRIDRGNREVSTISDAMQSPPMKASWLHSLFSPTIDMQLMCVHRRHWLKTLGDTVTTYRTENRALLQRSFTTDIVTRDYDRAHEINRPIRLHDTPRQLQALSAILSEYSDQFHALVVSMRSQINFLEDLDARLGRM